MLDLGYPQPHPGSEQEKRANFHTHRWDGQYDACCVNCDCKAGSVTSFWPCGIEPPRVHRDGTVSPLVQPFDPIDALAEAEEREPGGIA
jgi:hypothetical protein